METITLNGSGNGSQVYTSLFPGKAYRVRWKYNATTPAGGTLTITHGSSALDASTTTAKDSITGTAQTFDLTAVSIGEATVVAMESSIAFTVAGADAGDAVLTQLVPTP